MRQSMNIRDKLPVRRGNGKYTKWQIAKAVMAAIAVIMLLCVIIAAVRIRPLYKEAKERVYDILAEMDTGSFRRQTNTVVYDKDDKPIGKLGYEHYEYVSISKISKYIQQGYIDTEDKNFKTHNGVDFKATLRAIFKLIMNRGRITQGGSTITQQVIKNNLLTAERTFDRKILEILIAFQLEKEYTKADIMEFYCNSCYYGNSCYGVQGAAEYYFGKDAESVDIAEAAMIVGTSNLPNRYNPSVDYEACMRRKEFVLGQMLEEGDITEDEYKAAVEERPDVVERNDNIGAESYPVSYAVYCAALKLMEREKFQFAYTFESEEEYKAYRESYKEAYETAADNIRDGGFKIYTSINPDVQYLLQTSINNAMEPEKDKQENGLYDMQAAGICIDNENGMVIAIVGGRDGEFNRAYQSKRQPGSSIKPLLVYGPAMEEGVITPATVYDDSEIDINGYAPKNSDGVYRGDMTIRESIARSVNTVSALVFTDMGTETGLKYLDKMHFSSISFGDSYNTALALGGFTNGVTLADMARGYAAVENDGVMREKGCLRSIISETDGKIYDSGQDEGVRIYSEDTAFMLTDMLCGVFNEEYGTAHGAADGSQVYAGKTGTTNSNRDAWFAGYSRYYTSVIWTGCDEPQSKEVLVGNGYPLTIWKSFMDEMHEGLARREFDVPDTVLLSNRDGSEKSVDYRENIYGSRPDGWDYISGTLKKKVADTERKKRIASEKERAESAVANFENFQVNSVEDADSLGSRYEDVISVINEIEDEGEQSPFRERAEYKYSLLSSDVVETWEAVKEEARREEQAKTNAENEAYAGTSVDSAMQEIHDARVRAVQYYVDALNGRSVYTASIETLISGADTALERCSEYGEYDSLSWEVREAAEYARSLPTEEDLRRQIEEAAAEEAEAKKEAATNSAEPTVTPAPPTASQATFP